MKEKTEIQPTVPRTGELHKTTHSYFPAACPYSALNTLVKKNGKEAGTKFPTPVSHLPYAFFLSATRKIYYYVLHSTNIMHIFVQTLGDAGRQCVPKKYKSL